MKQVAFQSDVKWQTYAYLNKIDKRRGQEGVMYARPRRVAVPPRLPIMWQNRDKLGQQGVHHI